MTISSKEDVKKYAAKLQEQGARNVLVSMAGDGAVLLTEEGKAFESEAPKGKVKNSVGARRLHGGRFPGRIFKE